MKTVTRSPENRDEKDALGSLTVTVSVTSLSYHIHIAAGDRVSH